MRITAPVSIRYNATSPLVGHTAFLQFHERAIPAMIGRLPSAFERATAHALYLAYGKMPRGGTPVAFTAVSAATGGGKSNAACALIGYLVEQGHACAYVVATIEAVEEFRLKLESILPGRVAAYSTLHRANASPNKVRDYAEQGITVAAQFTEEKFAAAQVVVTTHDRWKRDLLEERDLGVLMCGDAPRALVVVDEEPELQVVYARQPEDVSALASVLADHVVAGESRAFGFTSAHPAAPALLAAHDRMFRVKANAAVPQVCGADIVTADDLDLILTVTRDDLARRLRGTSRDTVDYLYETVEFLVAAAEGRVFYSKTDGGAFHAYAMRLPVRPRTLILDGTADLNGLYAVGGHVVTVEAERANYAPARLFAVNPPPEFRGKMKSSGVFASWWSAKAYFDWFSAFLLENTAPGEEVLVYAKKALLAFGIHKSAEFDDSNRPDRRRVSTLSGRTIHWCSFGRGRGLNDWRNCTAYFQLGEFHMKVAVAMATVGSLTGRVYSSVELRNLSSQRHYHPEIGKVMTTHRAVTAKQNAARIAIRNLDDTGTCQAARLYFMDCDLALLERYRVSMFPGADEYNLIGYAKPSEGTSRDTGGGAERLAMVLLTTPEFILDVSEACALADVRAQDFARTIKTQSAANATEARGWRVMTRKEAGLDGRGKVLTRST